MTDDFILFQDLTKRMADTLLFPLEEVDTHHKSLNIRHTLSFLRIALLINEVLLHWLRSHDKHQSWSYQHVYGLTKNTAPLARIPNSFFHTFHLISSL